MKKTAKKFTQTKNSVGKQLEVFETMHQTAVKSISDYDEQIDELEAEILERQDLIVEIVRERSRAIELRNEVSGLALQNLIPQG